MAVVIISPPDPMPYKFSVTLTEAECTSMTPGFELGHLTSFGQRDVSGGDISRIFKRAFNIGLALLCFCLAFETGMLGVK